MSSIGCVSRARRDHKRCCTRVKSPAGLYVILPNCWLCQRKHAMTSFYFPLGFYLNTKQSNEHRQRTESLHWKYSKLLILLFSWWWSVSRGPEPLRSSSSWSEQLIWGDLLRWSFPTKPFDTMWTSRAVRRKGALLNAAPKKEEIFSLGVLLHSPHVEQSK